MLDETPQSRVLANWSDPNNGFTLVRSCRLPVRSTLRTDDDWEANTSPTTSSYGTPHRIFQNYTTVLDVLHVSNEQEKTNSVRTYRSSTSNLGFDPDAETPYDRCMPTCGPNPEPNNHMHSFGK
ncbi:unnamed protein product [Nippostrongylus brasiliensis]|uniref:Uncharacterized protein n=1 Tax=Nippostrongylus brasiliensis TaxID=27835 RepID=A0A0N4YHL0_NIPBR|nr:unnamed protein product [Nippostrongylus brasiliensis]